MGSKPREIGGGRKSLAARSPEVDFSLVLSRVIGSIHQDPAQLRNAVYELARIKLQREGWQRNPPLDLLEMRRLMLALESAIEHVEVVYSKHDELRALQSLERLIESSEIGAADMMIEGREPPLLMINEAPARTVDSDSLKAMRTSTKRALPKVAQLWHARG